MKPAAAVFDWKGKKNPAEAKRSTKERESISRLFHALKRPKGMNTCDATDPLSNHGGVGNVAGQFAGVRCVSFFSPVSPLNSCRKGTQK